MKRVQIQDLVEKGYSIRGIAEEVGKSPTTIRYCLKKYSLKTRGKYYKTCMDAWDGRCDLCRQVPKQYDDRIRRLCGSCCTRVRRYRAKSAAVKLLGGRCQRCSWNGDIAGFDFHHTSGDKEFNIGNVANRSWMAISKELLKCELLCRNCHSIEHTGKRDKAFFDIVERYQGELLT